LSPNVATGAESVANALAEDNTQTRLGLSTATRKAAKVFSAMDGETVIAKSPDLRRLTDTAAQIHEWGSNSDTGGPLSLNVLCGNAAIRVCNSSDDNDNVKLGNWVETVPAPSLAEAKSDRTKIDPEALRVLILAVGPAEAARRMGLEATALGK
jgi:hypothetical protein